jgi:antitoxin component YwqK of YwqJK toxin-antitoxin module
MKFLKCFLYFLTLIILGNFVLTGKEKVLPPPPLPKWSDFKYNSEEEREFWDQVSDFKIPGYYGWQRINSKGYNIPYDPYHKGYTGYQKKRASYSKRILSRYQDGFLVQRASWYKSGKIKSKETYKDGKRFGVWTEWHENGQKESEINYKDDKGEGLSVGWHEDGQKETEVNYREGKPDGLFVAWHPNGQKETEGNYKEGKQEGLWVAWDSKGQKREEVNYKEGKREGLWVAWHPNGQKREEVNYKEGKQEGLWVAWHSKGQKREEVNYKEGKREGLFVAWHEDGQKEKEVNYKEGKLEGLWVAWHPNGQKREEVNYKEGKQEGLWVAWHPNGQKIEGSYEEVKRLLLEKYLLLPRPTIRRFREAKIDSTYALSPWSKFNYNSEEEKEFWDKLPDWTNRTLNTPSHFSGRLWTRKNARGETIDKNSSEGFDGYVKYNSKSYRTIYQLVDGYTSRFKSWFKSGKQMAEGNFLKENRDGTWNEWYENGQKKSERNYKDGKVSGNAQFWTEDGKPSRPILTSPPRSRSRSISIPKKQEEQDQ